MRKVKNKKIISKFSIRTIKANRVRNFITIMGIMLTTILFTTLFTLTGTMIKTQVHYTIRLKQDQMQGHYKFLSYEQFEQLRKDKGIKDVTYRIAISDARNNKLKSFATEMNWMEDEDAKQSFCYPTTGRMPIKEDEIATSLIVLKSLGIQPKIGESVPVEYYLNNKLVRKTFRLCGYFPGDKVADTQSMLFSRTFADKETPVSHQTFNEVVKEGKDPYAGRIICGFNFKSQFNLQKQFKQLKIRVPLKGGIKAGLNEAYGEYSLTPHKLRELVAAVLLIMLSGYLIIYNIFYINVYSDIRNYGLLKVIGTTKKQLRKIVRKQAFFLSIFGIPIGLLVGWGIGCILAPVAMQNMDYRVDKTAVVCKHPLIFIGAALFSFITVYISSIRPCWIVQKVSLVEALNLNEATKKKKKMKRSHAVTPLFMAIENIKRNKMKLVIVVISLSLCLILINGIYTITKSFDFNMFIEEEISDDYTVTHMTINQAGNPFKVFDGVSDSFIKKFKALPGITQVGTIYYEETEQHMEDDPAFEKMAMSILNHKSVRKDFQRCGASDELKQYKKNKIIPAAISGFDFMAISKVKLKEGIFDLKKWNTGKYAICSIYQNPRKKWYQIGDKITVRTQKGEKRQYEVMGEIDDIPYSIGPMESLNMGLEILLPEKEYKKVYPKRKALRVIAKAASEKKKEIEAWLKYYTTVVDPNLDYKSKEGYRDELGASQGIYTIVGGGLAGIIGFIGLLNFTGVMIASIMARRNQFAMLEAVGMTARQQKKMLMIEGSIYALATVIVALIIDRLIQNRIINDMVGEIYYFKLHDTVAPILCSTPVLLIIVIVIPLAVYRTLCKKSIVDRLRIEN